MRQKNQPKELFVVGVLCNKLIFIPIFSLCYTREERTEQSTKKIMHKIEKTFEKNKNRKNIHLSKKEWVIPAVNKSTTNQNHVKCVEE
jgi:hypothetical protein